MDFELNIIHWLQSLRNTFLDFFFEITTMLGEELVLIVILGYVYWCYDKLIGEKMGLIVFVSLSINNLIKILVHRTRPYLVDSNIINLRPETSQGYSFPSGHTQIASTNYFGLYFLIKKKWLLWIAIIVTILVSISRMYIGAHYLTDILTGFVLGILIAYYISQYYDKIRNINLVYIIIFIITLLVFIVALIYYYIANLNNGVLNALNLYLDVQLIAKELGTIGGFVLGIFYEKKYVDFNQHKNIYKNIIRFILGIIIVVGGRSLLKYLFGLIINPNNLTNQEILSIFSLIFEYTRYFIIVFIGIGIYPKLFRYLKI